MDVQLTDLQQPCDAVMSIWTKYFKDLVESVAPRIKAVLKAAWSSLELKTWTFLIKCVLSVYSMHHHLSSVRKQVGKRTQW